MSSTPASNDQDAAGREREVIQRVRAQVEQLIEDASGETLDAQAGAPADFIPGYQILHEIHCGGQGVVYQAIQKATKRRVAIKVMKEGPFASPREKARFEREVEILGQLQHPNIVTIHDSGTVSGSFYYVMDYISGQPLDAWMAGQHSIEETLRLFGAICEAVNAAHLRGVIHRDLKPANIRVDANGQPHILDFGLAKVSTGTEVSLMTVTGQFVGSLPWASPEQAEAVPGRIDTRTDVYALGVILYQMLTGRFPCDVIGNMRDVLDRIMRTEPARPSTIRRQIDDELDTIVLKCLSKERERRYQTAGELARDIGHYLGGEPIEAKRDSFGYMLRKRIRRHRSRLTIAAGCAILLAGVALLLAHVTRANRQLAEAASFPEYLIRIRAAQKALNDGAWDTLRRQLDSAPARHRNWEWHYLHGLYEDHETLGQPAKSPPGWDLAFLQQPLVLRGHFTWTQSAVFSPDGAWLLTGSHDQTARLWDVATGRQLAVLRGHTGFVYRACFSPDNRLILTCSSDQTARLWDAATGRWPRSLEGHQGEVIAVGFSPDGHRIVTGSRDGTARLWDTASGKEMMVLRGHGGDVPSVNFSPDGTRVLTGSFDGTAWLWDAATGKPVRVLRGHRDEVVSAVFSPDGARIATGSEDATVRLWDAATGNEISALNGHSRRVYSVAFKPDGSRIASASEDCTIRLWDARTGEVVLVLPVPDRPFWVAFSPDGRRLVAACAYGGNAWVWDRQSMHVRHAERQAALAAKETAGPLVSASYARLRDWPRVAAEIRDRKDLQSEVRTQALNRVLLECAGERSQSERTVSAIYELDRLAQSTQGVQEGVKAVLSIDPQPAELALVFPRLLLWYGEFLIVGGCPERAAEVIEFAVGRKGAEDYYARSLGWALLSCGREQEARAAFKQSLRACPDWSSGPPPGANPDHWSAAYFLGWVTEQQCLQRWCDDRCALCGVWFDLGQLRELRGQREEAIVAYRQSIALNTGTGGHWSGNFAAYRLGILTGTIPPPVASRPGTTRPAP